MHLSEIPASSTTPAWLTQVLDIGKGAMALRQQSQIQKINMERLQKGMSPIEAGDVAVGAKVAMDDRQLNKILLASAAAMAVLLFVMVRRRK